MMNDHVMPAAICYNEYMDAHGGRIEMKRWKYAAGAALLLAALACALFGSLGYDAGAAAGAIMEGRTEQGGAAVFTPEGEPIAGMIFYPGGLVDHAAYAPLMQGFAKEGYFCALVKMPFGLAVFDTNAAKDVKEAHPEISHWIIGGHSLGGAMAAKYAAISDFDGLFLLAAYTTTDMSDKDIPVVSVYGDADGVLNMDDYAANKSNLPADTVECVIKGGNHSQFGSYGLQEGDGEAGIPAEKQRTQTVRLVLDNIDADK